MRKLLFYMAVIAVLLTGFNAHTVFAGQIIMTVKHSGITKYGGIQNPDGVLLNTSIRFHIAASSMFTIDWGDGTEKETVNEELAHFGDLLGVTFEPIQYKCRHVYSDTSVRIITIVGENITYLSCELNHILNLDVSKNTALKYLNCGQLNQLTSLDVSNNTALEELDCSGNMLTRLDVRNNTALVRLNCNLNQLTSLDVSNNTALEELDCSGNMLTRLDLRDNTALVRLNCAGNLLTKLDVSKNTPLTWLNCRSNRLSIKSLNKLFRTLSSKNRRIEFVIK